MELIPTVTTSLKPTKSPQISHLLREEEARLPNHAKEQDGAWMERVSNVIRRQILR